MLFISGHTGRVVKPRADCVCGCDLLNKTDLVSESVLEELEADWGMNALAKSRTRNAELEMEAL